MAGGRPTTYSQEFIDEICARLSEGQSMRTISRDPEMPALSTMFKWLRENQEFSDQYAKAKEEAAEALAEEMFDIADDGTNDWMEKLDKDEQPIGYQLNGEHIQRSRLRVDTRKWYLSKLKPKKYGEKVTQELVGKDGGPIETTQINFVPVGKDQ